MKLDKAEARDKKRHRRKHGMRVTGASTKALPEILAKRAKKQEKK